MISRDDIDDMAPGWPQKTLEEIEDQMDEDLTDSPVFAGPNELDLGLARIRLEAECEARDHARAVWVDRDIKALDAAITVHNLERQLGLR